MGDISNNYNPLVEADAELKTDFIKIQISEKVMQKAQLNVTMEKLKSVELKKIELQLKVLDREIKDLESTLVVKNGVETVINAEFTTE